MTSMEAPTRETTKRAGPMSKGLDLVSFVARFYMAYVWMAAGLSKITGNRLEVAQHILAYDIFTLKWSYLLGSLIGPLELAGGLLLLFGIFLRGSSKVGVGVLVLFIIGISQAWLRGMELTCGCFGAEVVQDYPKMYFETIVRDLFYIALSAWTIARPYARWALRV